MLVLTLFQKKESELCLLFKIVGPRYEQVGGRVAQRGVWCLSGKLGALRPEGCRLEAHSSSHIGTLGSSSLTVACSALAC